MADSILAWRFLPVTGRLRDGRQPPPDGEWLEHDGPIKMCESSLHASVRAIDAIRYATGPIVCRVECAGYRMSGVADMFACRRRRILWRADATAALRRFARRRALAVARLWDMPLVMRQFLKTGDESLRASARASALSPAVDDVSWACAPEAAQASACRATLNPACTSAWDAAWASAWASAWAYTLEPGRSSARDAALDSANTELTDLLLALAPKGEASNA